MKLTISPSAGLTVMLWMGMFMSAALGNLQGATPEGGWGMMGAVLWIGYAYESSKKRSGDCMEQGAALGNLRGATPGWGGREI